MADTLNWTSQGATLALSGPLDRESLLPLWQQRSELLGDKQVLDLSALERVDSAGLALLVHLYQQCQARGAFSVIGAGERLKTLIALYNLDDIFPVG